MKTTTAEIIATVFLTILMVVPITYYKEEIWLGIKCFFKKELICKKCNTKTTKIIGHLWQCTAPSCKALWDDRKYKEVK